MLEKISWLTYLVSIFAVTLIYYGWVSLTFYRAELAGLLRKGPEKQTSTRQQPTLNTAIIGQTAPEAEMVAGEQDLLFGPGEPDESATGETAEPRQIGEFSEMVGEIKTLIRVMAESAESRENFELLFGLIVQKYPALSATQYRSKIIGFLLAESEGVFPFNLCEEELVELWNDNLKN